MKFKIGDRVKYISGHWGDYESNPLWGGDYGNISGKVTYIDTTSSNPISVNWDNDECNTYKINDLALIKNIVDKSKQYGIVSFCKKYY